MMKQLFTLALALFITRTITAQENRLTKKPVSSAAIYHKLEKLNFLGTALFIAAHPDDENTRLISYLANDRNARTAYLSLTRGDGGQNLIGPQLREQLGLIRTQELLEARHIDGGQQFFTRANDFGYSKHPDETLEIWDKQQVLEDMIRIIRTFKPDVIINRFDHRSPGSTHGHHTSSAMLSMIAYDNAGLKTVHADQLKTVDTWQPSRIFFNTSWWFYGSEDAFEKADKTNLLQLDAGGYYPWLGFSNGEIAALSRSEHKSQGFGSSGTRGSQTEYLEFLKGDFPTDKSDLFSGINTTWSRVKGGAAIGKKLEVILAAYDFKNPEKSLPALADLHKEISALKDDHWKAIKLADLETIITDIAGIYVELASTSRDSSPGTTTRATLELTNRGNSPAAFEVLTNNVLNSEKTGFTINANQTLDNPMTLTIPDGYESSTPYWLKETGTIGMYAFTDKNNTTIPESPAVFYTDIAVTIAGISFNKRVPLVYKTTDPVRGEVREPFYVSPAVAVAIENPVYIFSDTTTKIIKTTLTANSDTAAGSIALKHPAAWTVTPASISFDALKKGQTRTYAFTVKAPTTAATGQVTALVTIGNATYDKNVITLDYDHIPDQQYIVDASAAVVKPALINKAQRVAYINGAGDDVAQAIMAIGSQVDSFIPSTLPSDLTPYDAVVIGIRAANVHDDLPSIKPQLDTYVKNGGTLVMQYNTAGRFNSDALGPLSITLSRKRVTDENAPVTFLTPNHKVLTTPNRITQDDFKDWVQERGLYFPTSWDPAFTPILGMNDAGEESTNGSLIVAPYGKGHIAYTGLSLFRELPAGVPGAYRLLANLLSLSK